jgi:hypothetical protein
MSLCILKTLADIPRFTVIDEADELLSSGWEEAMEKLFQGAGMCAFLTSNDMYLLYLQTSTPMRITPT